MKTRFVYISGGDNVRPAEIKAALDEIRKNLGLSNDVVLFGVPIDEETPTASEHEDFIKPSAVQEHKVLQFPSTSHKKSSILNVIANPEHEKQDSDPIFETPLAVDEIVEEIIDENYDKSSITDLLGKMPGLNEEETPTESNKTLVQEFNEFLDKAEEKSAPKKAKPFGRKKNVFTNVLGDLFSYHGMAANDDAHEFKLPDFIKRP